MSVTGDRLRLTYPDALPITGQRAVLLDALREHQVVVVAGETGSGKSTQLPKLCLELGRGVDRRIGHTQPRRLATRTVAARIAEELGTPLGHVVGYKVRFSDRVGERTRVKLMTDGILLAELRHDRRLEAYDTIIVDEAHERSLNVDFLLGYLTELLPQRPDLKVVITSATIDTERFARHFDAPVVEVSGRNHPVEVRYRPRGASRDGDDQRGDGDDPPGGDTIDQVDAIRLAVDELRAEGPGDILVFLSGEREIRDAAHALSDAHLPDTEILPLYARLSAAEQQRAFRPHRGRRIVLATNVAETSITVPGVRYVVDPGTARISRYNRRTKMQRLPIEPVSQASANQRAGRCGRVAPGICIRLYSEDDFAGRPEFTEPEILRTNLASVILQMAELELGDIGTSNVSAPADAAQGGRAGSGGGSFPFVDAPDARAVRDAVTLLVELGAMRPDRTLTRQGRLMARLPVDPRFGRMLLEADANGCLREVTIIVAGLSIQDPRERPRGQEQEADELHGRFTAPGSDFLAYLNLWEYLAAEQRARSGNQFRRMCRAEHLHYVRVREWQDLVRQLREAVHDVGLGTRKRGRDQRGRDQRGRDQRRHARRSHDRPPADPDAIHRSLLAGLLSHVGMWDRSTRDHRGARQAHFRVAPGSVLARSSATWVMAAELVETERLWARVVARIDPSWIEPLADHLVQRDYGEPRWSRRRGTAVTDERVLLYGLPVVSGRPVPLGQVDPTQARELFIRHALVEGDWDHPPHAFLQANRRLYDEVRDLAARSRRPDLVLTDDRLADLYDRRLPAEVTSTRHFQRWWRDTREREPDRLTFTLDDLVEPGAVPVDPTDFPTTWTVGSDDGETNGHRVELDLSYVFDPGAADDGVTVHVPLAVLPSLTSDRFDWHVPGHRTELVAALTRTLPKALRRQLAPLRERAEEALAGMSPDDGALLDALARRLAQLTGTAVASTDFDPTRLPPHLRMRFSIEHDDSTVIAVGRDLDVLADELAAHARRAVASGAHSLERAGLRAWEIGTLPRTVEATVAGRSVPAYPAVVDEGETVGVRVVATAEEQERLMWAGSRRLLLLAVPRARSQVTQRLEADPALAAFGPGLPTPSELADDALAAAADRILTTHGGPAWDEDDHKLLERQARDRLAPLAVAGAGKAADLVAAASALDERLRATVAATLRPAVDDMRQHLDRLVHPGFVSDAGLARLPDIARYIEAVEHRLDKLRERPERDREQMLRARTLDARFDELVAGLPQSRRQDPEVVEARWLLEELRVSLFAQVVGTAKPVSEQRVGRALAALQ